MESLVELTGIWDGNTMTTGHTHTSGWVSQEYTHGQLMASACKLNSIIKTNYHNDLYQLQDSVGIYSCHYSLNFVILCGKKLH